MSQIPTDAIARFWSWFKDHHADVAALTGGDDPRWDDVLERLHRVDPEISFELSDPSTAVREFVITAEGDGDKFPLVDAMVAAAPAVHGWEIVALKPAMGFEFVTEYEGVELDPREMWFLPLEAEDDPAALGIVVAVPNLTRSNRERVENGVLIILDTALGERAAATAFDHLEVEALPKNPEKEGYIELPELPEFLEWREKRRSMTGR